jgi:hypothetical protein
MVKEQKYENESQKNMSPHSTSMHTEKKEREREREKPDIGRIAKRPPEICHDPSPFSTPYRPEIPHDVISCTMIVSR